MKKITLNKFSNSLFNLEISNDDDLIGNLSVYFNKEEKTYWLDLNIEKKWQGRWLTKRFAIYLYRTFIMIAKEHNIHKVYTCLNNPKSLRLLEFFGFIYYYGKYYYLKIK